MTVIDRNQIITANLYDDLQKLFIQCVILDGHDVPSIDRCLGMQASTCTLQFAQEKEEALDVQF